ncbi:MAG: hypothetical protein NVS4B8_25250 [Herpetosiphon sp.]
MSIQNPSNRRADASLVLVTLIWGTTFTVVHEAVTAIPPLALILLRFGLASLALAPFAFRRGNALSLRGVVVGLGLGALLFLGFATQTLGLATSSPARAGFITGLNVVLVPIFGWLWGHRPGPMVILGVALSMLGLALTVVAPSK